MVGFKQSSKVFNPHCDGDGPVVWSLGMDDGCQGAPICATFETLTLTLQLLEEPSALGIRLTILRLSEQRTLKRGQAATLVATFLYVSAAFHLHHVKEPHPVTLKSVKKC